MTGRFLPLFHTSGTICHFTLLHLPPTLKAEAESVFVQPEFPFLIIVLYIAATLLSA